MRIATVSSKMQITFHIDELQELGVKPGDKVILTVKGNSIVVTPYLPNTQEQS